MKCVEFLFWEGVSVVEPIHHTHHLQIKSSKKELHANIDVNHNLE